MKQKMAATIVLIGLAGLIAGWFVGFSLGYHQGKLTNINSYEECVAAGYPVQDSYPERCLTPGGGGYTNPSTNVAPAVGTNGVVVCLEHKNSDQPHTLECAAGLKTEDGKTYILKEGDAELAALAGSDTKVRVQGTVQEKENATYQSTGELIVDSYTIIE